MWEMIRGDNILAGSSESWSPNIGPEADKCDESGELTTESRGPPLMPLLPGDIIEFQGEKPSDELARDSRDELREGVEGFEPDD